MAPSRRTGYSPSRVRGYVLRMTVYIKRGAAFQGKGALRCAVAERADGDGISACLRGFRFRRMWPVFAAPSWDSPPGKICGGPPRRCAPIVIVAPGIAGPQCRAPRSIGPMAHGRKRIQGGRDESARSVRHRGMETDLRWPQTGPQTEAADMTKGSATTPRRSSTRPVMGRPIPIRRACCACLRKEK